jgi:hypothetical protein
MFVEHKLENNTNPLMPNSSQTSLSHPLTLKQCCTLQILVVVSSHTPDLSGSVLKNQGVQAAVAPFRRNHTNITHPTNQNQPNDK